ncbi:hypothetical protein R70723_20050 [Paenibacillus sp. FSL R7-0273]|uniref:hypothetical protein n=1 Tax=Paenibacillus sp. FSL R7-0273 TaxID=1536772 RepID=UPI0004F71E77|nr:hypothetical protein [Paenibacillus sp. FSL R7-0273]AIQ47939.1 hypothetical protein R70723_20050 [Paenibacillus sp. FSL R7-0273]OMF94510.1 hypothetical protein BK144_08250 [Paenibacillus sp. FSL R7-0273]
MADKKIGASDYLALGLYAFAGFGLEVVLSMLLPLLFGIGGSDYTLIHHCIHWTLTCILWGSMAMFLIRLSRKKYSFDIMKLNETPDSKGWLLAVVVSIIAIAVTTIVWDGFKPVQEYNGIVEFIFQNVYYMFEAALILLTIAFGQKLGETLIKRGGLPFGGIFLALTWGLVHIFLQGGQTGVYAFFMSVLYGLVYILLKKNIRYSYMMIAIVFVL